ILDGTSNTFLLAERNFAKIDPSNQPVWMLWFSGAYSDTMWSTVWPVNVWKQQGLKLLNGDNSVPGGGDPSTDSAGSNHPGGANCAMCDGSVKFIRDSINSWPINYGTGFPQGVTFVAPTTTGLNVWTVAPGTPQGIYQALSTRAGGEVISADQY